MRTPGAPARRAERGYVLLALLASSAVLVATLALSLPRMAMQRQRDREQRLIERGEQYQRAIELYYREHGKYPEELEDLEDTDGVRYLRRRHDDPMGETGEWRIIHMGTDGRFEDSLLFDTEEEGPAASRGAFGGPARSGPGLPPGAVPPSAPTGPDGGLLAGPAGPGPYGAADPRLAPGPQRLVGAARARTLRESAAPDAAGRDRYSEGFGLGTGPGTAGGDPPDRSRMLPSLVPMDENERFRDAPYGPGGLPAGAPEPGTVPGFMQAPPGARASPSSPGSQAAGNPSGLAAGSGATEMIHRLLTTPRAPGQAGGQGPAAVQQVFERGIAGVASTSEELGIKVYNGREAFNEWEFVFDYRDAAGTQGGAAPQARQPGGVPASAGSRRRIPAGGAIGSRR